MIKELPLITGVRPVSGSTGATGDVVLKFEAETADGPMLLHFTSTAACELKGFLDTPVKSMRLGGCSHSGKNGTLRTRVISRPFVVSAPLRR